MPAPHEPVQPTESNHVVDNAIVQCVTFLHDFVDNIMQANNLDGTRQTTLSRMSLTVIPILCGNAIAINNVRMNDVLFGKNANERCIHRHHGNLQLYTLVNNALTSTSISTNKADITTIIETLMEDGVKFLRCDKEQECFFQMNMTQVRSQLSRLLRKGLEGNEFRIENCVNFHTLISFQYDKRDKRQVSYLITILIFL